MKTAILTPKLHEGQIEVARSQARFKVVAAGRRWGKTQLAVLLALKAAAEGGRAWWVAPSYKMANVGWNLIRHLSQQIVRRPFSVRIKDTDHLVQFPNGGLLQVRSADDPQTLRGESLAFVVLDECAYMKPAAWYEALRPALADQKGRALFISTPHGRDWFWERFQAGLDPDSARKDWVAFQFPTHTNPHVDPQEIETARHDLPDRIFRQEYLAEFIADAGGVFRFVAEASTAQQADPEPGHVYVGGVDFGRTTDFTVISIVDATTLCQVYLDRFTGGTWETQRRRIEDVARRYAVDPLVCESNSFGSPNIEALHQVGISAEAFLTTASSKQALIDRLTVAIERAGMGLENGIHLLNDPIQIAELQAYQVEAIATGYRYSAPPGLHDDCVMALALALHALHGRFLNRHTIEIGESPFDW